MNNSITIREAIQKIESFCAYQERCHQEVQLKLRSMTIDSDDIAEIMVHLIAQNFLNETRFACSFARGKHRIKSWGKIRITNELKLRNVLQNNISTALKEITSDEYLNTFHLISERNWDHIQEKNILKKRKKFCDFLLRKGFESQLVYEKLKELESKK